MTKSKCWSNRTPMGDEKKGRGQKVCQTIQMRERVIRDANLTWETIIFIFTHFRIVFTNKSLCQESNCNCWRRINRFYIQFFERQNTYYHVILIICLSFWNYIKKWEKMASPFHINYPLASILIYARHKEPVYLYNTPVYLSYYFKVENPIFQSFFFSLIL